MHKARVATLVHMTLNFHVITTVEALLLWTLLVIGIICLIAMLLVDKVLRLLFGKLHLIRVIGVMMICDWRDGVVVIILTSLSIPGALLLEA